MSLLTAELLTKSYRGRTVLDCSIELPEGKVIALVGPNGAGKSTLLNIAAGLVRQTSGSIALFDDVEPGSQVARERIAFVSQDMVLHKRLSVKQTLQLAESLNHNFDPTAAKRRIEALEIDLKSRIRSLSGGQRSQIALSLALAKNPDALILDEPTAALDPLARHEFLSQVMQAVADTNVSVIFSSHSIEDLAQVSDHVTLLAQGQLRMNDSIDEVEQSHALVHASLNALEELDGVEVIEADVVAAVGQHLVHVLDSTVISGFPVATPHLSRIILGYLRNSKMQQRNMRKAA